MTRFMNQVHLRTTDVSAARAFYEDVLGHAEVPIFQLHEQALARGAVPHWLGYLGVGDVDAAVKIVVEHGGAALGPKWRDPQGTEAANVRDPSGAVLSLAQLPAPSLQGTAGPQVTFRILNADGVERAKRYYGEVHGWHFHAAVSVPDQGTFYPYSYAEGEPQVGAIGDIAGRPGIHSHWLYQLAVNDIDRAMDRVRALGGVVAAAHQMPSGTRVAVCDDAQGAAFCLRQEP